MGALVEAGACLGAGKRLYFSDRPRVELPAPSAGAQLQDIEQSVAASMAAA